MELREIGIRLSDERERRGLGLEDIAQQTKISLTSLQGIESGRSDLLPHPVYVRGFIKVYAKFLDLDLGEALNELKFEKEDAPYKPVYKSASPERVNEQPEVRSLRSSNRLGVAVVVLLLVLAGATYWFFATTSEPAKPVEQTAQEPADDVAKSALAEAPAEAPVEPAPTTEALAAPEVGPSVSAQSAVVQPAPVAAPTQTAPIVAQQPQAAPSQSAPTNTAVISAREACWVQATHEDGTVREYMLQPGGSVRLSFSKVALMLGNAGGVDISLNGQTYAMNAQSGQVRRLTLP